VQLAADFDFDNIVHDNPSYTEASESISNLTPGTTYYFRVKGNPLPSAGETTQSFNWVMISGTTNSTIPDDLIQSNTDVEVIGGNYIFNYPNQSQYLTPYKIEQGTFTLNVPSAHPITVHNIGKESLITINGTTGQSFIKTSLDGNEYIYYYGEVVINVYGDFDTVSYECYYHGYMGGQNNLEFYSPPPATPTPTPTPTPTRGTQPTPTPTPTQTPTQTTTPTTTPDWFTGNWAGGVYSYNQRVCDYRLRSQGGTTLDDSETLGRVYRADAVSVNGIPGDDPLWVPVEDDARCVVVDLYPTATATQTPTPTPTPTAVLNSRVVGVMYSGGSGTQTITVSFNTSDDPASRWTIGDRVIINQGAPNELVTYLTGVTPGYSLGGESRFNLDLQDIVLGEYTQNTSVVIDFTNNVNVPTPTPTQTPTGTPTGTPASTPTNTPTPTLTPTQTQTPTPTLPPPPIQWDVLYEPYGADTMTANQKSIVQDALDKWSQVVLADRFITVNVEWAHPDDRGPGAMLANATVNSIDFDRGLPEEITVKFDPEDLSSYNSSGLNLDTTLMSNGKSLMYYVALHEIAHGLGIGVLWNHTTGDPTIDASRQLVYGNNGLIPYNNNLSTNDLVNLNPVYTGAYGVAAYKEVLLESGWPQSEVDNINSIPVEDEGGQGTASVHLEETYYGRWINSQALPGLEAEISTGYLQSSTVNPLSKITVGLLKDLGWYVDSSQAETFTIPYNG